MMLKKDVKWCLTYWSKLYLKHFRKYGLNALLTAHARGNAYAYAMVLNPKRGLNRLNRKEHFGHCHYDRWGRQKLFKNTWLGKLLGLKNK